MTGWMDRAACKGLPTNLFFPDAGDVGGQWGGEEPIAVCGSCPVRQDCLEFAVKNRIREGIWGGMFEKQRRELYDELRVVRLCKMCGEVFVVGPHRRTYCDDECLAARKRTDAFREYHARYRREKRREAS